MLDLGYIHDILTDAINNADSKYSQEAIESALILRDAIAKNWADDIKEGKRQAGMEQE